MSLADERLRRFAVDAIGIDNNLVVGPHRTGPRNQRRTPLAVNTALYPTLMWNSRFAALSGDPFDNTAGFQFPPPEGLSFPRPVRRAALIDSWRRPVTLAAALRVERTRAIIFFGDRMGRIRQLIRVDGRECWTLFDTGARNTYVVPQVASLLSTAPTHRPFRSALGGKVLETNTVALLEADVEGHRISTHAMVVDYIGTDEDGRSIEILFGALAMQQWGIRPVPDEERLDLSHYPEEFVEF